MNALCGNVEFLNCGLLYWLTFDLLSPKLISSSRTGADLCVKFGEDRS